MIFWAKLYNCIFVFLDDSTRWLQTIVENDRLSGNFNSWIFTSLSPKIQNKTNYCFCFLIFATFIEKVLKK